MATSAIDTARGRLLDAIVSGLTGLPSWRVHRYPPSSVVSPCAYIDMPGMQLMPDAVSAEFPVTLVIDGAAAAQLQQLDLAVAALWDAIDRLDGVLVTSAYPISKDIGGPSQRAYTLTVVTYLAHRPLCDVPLSEATPAAVAV